MKILTINASDYMAGGAAGVAMELHNFALAESSEAKMIVGKKTSNNESVLEIKRPFYTKIISYLLSNDIDFFRTDYLLESKEVLSADIVHFHNVSGWYFNLKTMMKISHIKPTVWTLHDMWALTPHCGHTSSEIIENGLFICSNKNLYPTTLWNNDHYLSFRKSSMFRQARLNVVTPCNWLAEKLSKTTLAEKFHSVIHNGIDTKVFKLQDKASSKLRFNVQGKRVVLFVASDPVNNVYKGFSDFKWTAENCKLCDTEFWAIGADNDGVLGNVRLIKATQDKALISTYLACADILMLSSRHEVFPLVVLEALSCGTPVIAYDVGGVKEAISDLPGCRVVEPLNRYELMWSLESALIEIGSRNTEIGEQLNRFVEEKYSKVKMLNQYFELYSSLIAGSKV